MAHAAYAGSHGNRSKHHNQNFEALFGLSSPPRRSGSRSPVQSQHSGRFPLSPSGLPMGACGRGISVSSGYSEHPSQASVTARCNVIMGIRVVSGLAVLAGALMLACGLFIGQDGPIPWLCIVGALLILAVAILWCALYVWYGKYCGRKSGSAALSSPNGGGTHRWPARSTTEVTRDVQPSRSANDNVMASYGPDTRMISLHSPPSYAPVGRSIERPPSTPPPPYHDVT